MILYEFMDARRKGVITDWQLQAKERRALDQKLDLLRKIDRNMAVGSVVFKMKASGIYKMKVKGRVQLRPMLCFGPFDSSSLTLLERATERDDRLVPADAPHRAARTMDLIRQSPMESRRLL